jgi:hypothetical protein
LKTVTEKTGDVTTENITEADAPVLITMAVPPGMRGGTDYKIYHVHTMQTAAKSWKQLKPPMMRVRTRPPYPSGYVNSVRFKSHIPRHQPTPDWFVRPKGSKVQAASAQVDILVNGKTEKIGIFAEGKQDGRSFASVTPDEKELEQILQQSLTTCQ